MRKNEVTINGITYIAVDEPMIKGYSYSCAGCDILNAKPPQTMVDRPLCYDHGRKWVSFSCCSKLGQNIRRIWKIKSQLSLME